MPSQLHPESSYPSGIPAALKKDTLTLSILSDLQEFFRLPYKLNYIKR